MIYLCYFFSIQNFFHFLTEISLEVTDEKFRADLNYKKLLDTKFPSLCYRNFTRCDEVI